MHAKVDAGLRSAAAELKAAAERVQDFKSSVKCCTTNFNHAAKGANVAEEEAASSHFFKGERADGASAFSSRQSATLRYRLPGLTCLSSTVYRLPVLPVCICFSAVPPRLAVAVKSSLRMK